MGNLNDFELLARNGFIIHANEQGDFIVEKKPSKFNGLKINAVKFDSFQESIDYINNILNKPNEWTAIVRFNKGLGIEYKNISPINADSKEEAKKTAFKQAEKLLGDYIIEVKVVPTAR